MNFDTLPTPRHPGMRLLTAGLLLLLLTSGCGRDSGHVSRPPVAIEPADSCHVCGMAIFGFPGPKGELYRRQDKAPVKFCSTRDMFAYMMQAEVRPRILEAYVHDAGAGHWDNPTDDSFIDARTAWYVINHPLQGAMGATLAPFRERAAADAFAEKYYARVISFEEITPEIIAGLDRNDDAAHQQPPPRH